MKTHVSFGLIFFITLSSVIFNSSANADDSLCPVDSICGNHQGKYSEDEININIVSSYQEIFGRNPSPDEFKYWEKRINETGETYNQILEVHRDWKNRGGQ